MPSELSTFQRFNSAIIPEAAFTPVWEPRRASALGADARIKRQSRPYFQADLSGALLNEKQKDDLYGMIWRNGGMTKPVLVKVPPFCEIGEITGIDANDDPIVTPALLGIGDGTQMDFPVRKRLKVTGYDDEFFYFDVRFLHWDFPPQYGIARTIAGPVPYNDVREIVVYGNGVPLADNQFEVFREDGMVRVQTTEDVEYSIAGTFYILMLLPNKIPMMPKGACLWEIKSNVQLIEPYGGL